MRLCLSFDPSDRPNTDELADTLAYMAAQRGTVTPTANVLLDKVIYAAAADFTTGSDAAPAKAPAEVFDPFRVRNL